MKQIRLLFERIVEITKNNNLHIDYNPVYGGYKLVERNPTNGSESDSVYDGIRKRLPKKEFICYLTGIVIGLNFKK